MIIVITIVTVVVIGIVTVVIISTRCAAAVPRTRKEFPPDPATAADLCVQAA